MGIRIYRCSRSCGPFLSNMTSVVNFLLRILILVHIVKCDLEPLFQRCCALGRNKITESLKCESKIRTPIPRVADEQQGICLSIIDLCCVQFLRETACESGKQAAKQNKNCNIQLKTDNDVTYKHCCESCKLGIITRSMSMDCKGKNFHFDSPWQKTYESCCEEYTSTSNANAPIANVSSKAEPINICEQLPGELCSQICVPVEGSYKCQCRAGFVLMADSKSCRQDIQDRCEPHNFCDQKCFDNGKSIECSCRTGYELLADNKTCVDINECSLEIDNCHDSEQTCRNTIGGYECLDIANILRTSTISWKPTTNIPIVCPNGYRYDANSDQCLDIDECKETNTCDRTTERCLNTPGSYRCDLLVTNRAPEVITSSPRNCGIGYQYDAGTKSCKDENECKEDPCSEYENCENLVGSFTCSCKIGFQRDRVTGACIDINECQLRKHNCDSSQRCDNTIGSYQCMRNSPCGTGYTLNSAINICEDDDECVLGTDNCKRLGPEWECRNLQGSFRCEKKRCENANVNCTKVTNIECQLGYEFVNGRCIDIDECKRKNLCRNDQNCVNTEGGYRCITKPSCTSLGLRYNKEQTQCVDIDECAEQPTVCDHTCSNTWGSFRCSCKAGYFLHNDTRSCIDINECEVYKNLRLCMGFCANTPGSYKCQCPEGYILDANEVTCNDINECAAGTICSKPNEMCINTRGSHRCNAIICPPNYQLDSAHKNRCTRTTNFCILNPNCAQMASSYSFNYMTLPSNHPLPTTGRYDLFYLRGTTSSTTATRFSFDLKDVHAPQEVDKIAKDYFRLNYLSANEVALSLIRPIQGPQDIELNLKMEFTTDGVVKAFSIHKLFLYISQYDF